MPEGFSDVASSDRLGRRFGGFSFCALVPASCGDALDADRLRGQAGTETHRAIEAAGAQACEARPMMSTLLRLRAAIERRFIRDWRKVLRHSWSVRLLGLAFLFSAAEVALPYLQSVLPLSQGWFGVLSGLATGAAFVARLLAQKQFQVEEGE